MFNLPKEKELYLEDKVQTIGKRKVFIDKNEKLVKFVSIETFQLHSVVLTFEEVEKVFKVINN
jgi:hypothetical protein